MKTHETLATREANIMDMDDDFEHQVTFIDRTGWGEGPWDREPDRVEWRTRGFVGLARRVPHSGIWCGYVGLPPGHPYHGLGIDNYDELGAIQDAAHGGLTFAAPCPPHDELVSLTEVERLATVCHVPREGESDEVWWLGFDCHHHMDRAPGAEARERQYYEEAVASGDRRAARVFSPDRFETGAVFADCSYKSLGFVRERIEAMAEAAERANP